MIEVKNLKFTYHGVTDLTLKGFDFAVERGQILGFLGPSGAGKSTTQKILIGLLKDYQGEISVMGKDLKGWDSDYYERIGVSFELLAIGIYRGLCKAGARMFVEERGGAIAEP